MLVATRRCPRCGQTKGSSEFYKGPSKERLSSYCKPCDRDYKAEYYKKNREVIRVRSRAYVEANRERLREYGRKHREKNRESIRAYMLRRNYGVERDEYLRLLEEQGGLCAICGDPPGQRELSVDHHHATGFVRGLLCDRCNHGLGLFKDNPDRLMAAIDYLLLRPDESRKLAAPDFPN